MVLLSNLVTYSSITYDVGHRAASINEPAWRLGVEEGRKKGYDDLFASCYGRAFDGIEHCRTVVGKKALLVCIASLNEQMGIYFNAKARQGPKSGGAMYACCLCR